jgi:hypothetical protein
MAVILQVEVFWVVTPCGVGVRCQRFRDPCCLHLQGEVKWRQQGSLKHWYLTTKLHGVITQKMETVRFSEALVSQHNTRRHNPEELDLMNDQTSDSFDISLKTWWEKP